MSLGKILLILALFGGASSAGAQNILDFSIKVTSDPNGVIPELSWATTPQATSCTASGDWTGSKVPAGAQLLPLTNVGKTYNLSCVWPGSSSITLTWVPPTKNTDGSDLTDLAGYKIYYSTSPVMSTNTIKDVPADATSTVLGELAAGAWYMAASAYNAAGVEGPKTSIVSKTLAPEVSLSHTVRVTFPNSPTNLTVE